MESKSPSQSKLPKSATPQKSSQAEPAGTPTTPAPQSWMPWLAAASSVAMLWLTGPTGMGSLGAGSNRLGEFLWPFAFVALVPLFWLVRSQASVWKRPVYLAFFAYYFLSLQGLRHAHPLMILPLIALAGYLAIYPLWFVACLKCFPNVGRKMGMGGNVLWAATLWVGGEWIRNYFATGISVLMLGHTLVDMPGPLLVQIADLGGTYAVSFLLVIVNAGMADAFFALRESRRPDLEPQFASGPQAPKWKSSVAVASIALALASLYGAFRLNEKCEPSSTTFLLVGRDEQTEYQQDIHREIAIYQSYAQQTIQAVAESDQPIDAVVWPESMLSGGQPWLIAEPDLVVPRQPGESQANFSPQEFRRLIEQSQGDFTTRSVMFLDALKSSGRPAPALIGGCGIVRYGAVPQQFSGVLQINPKGQVAETYAKNHLVMFGEYIPLIKSIPVLRDYVPPGLGLDAGTGPQIFEVAGLRVLPNLCIETAVERISVNHLAELRDNPPDVIVTLTNDVWFDHTAVVDHHLRCAQMVAIGCRRPILSSANGGPTAWIDSSGRVVKKVPYDQAGTILATPAIDERTSLYSRLGSWPAGMAAMILLIASLQCVRTRRSIPSSNRTATD
ncbi:apolipoprotein N-acyltransferase [Neorhodopirellula lusitana]|uniref:apolipoprotein N-acyltransferase n=1 Tax=Neorhodopirellula lusitana TaxID=445327 RepID=UPI00384BAAE3